MKRNLIGIVCFISFCLLLFAVSMPTEARDYHIRASDGEIYTVTLIGKYVTNPSLGNFSIRNISVRDLDGEMLRGATEAERKIATELYSAALLFSNVISKYNPESLQEYENWEQKIDEMAAEAFKNLKIRQGATFAGGVFATIGVGALMAKIKVLAIGTAALSKVVAVRTSIEAAEDFTKVLSSVNSWTAAKRERKLLIDAAVVAQVAAREAERHQKILRNFWDYEIKSAVIPITEVDAAWESFYKMNRYGGISHDLVYKYILTPGSDLKERLGKYFRSIAPTLHSSAEVINSVRYTDHHLGVLADLLQNMVQGVNDEESEYTANKKKDFRTELDDAGFFQPRRAKRLRDVQLQLQLDGSPLRLNVREYFLPNGDNLTYTPRSDNPRIAGARAVRAGSPVIIVTPKGLGSTSIAVELRNFRGLTATQRFDVTVKEAIAQDPLQNQNLQTVGNVPAQTLQLGDSPRALYMSNYFRAPAGSTLTYQAWPNPTGIVRLKRAGARITITPVGTGSTTVVVRATDPSGLHVSQSISVTVKKQPAIQPPIAVSIPDASLAAAIREEIGNSITTHTLLNLKSLDADNRKIRDLTGLEHAHNLESLDLVNNGIRDVSPLEKLTKLTKLELMVNPIRNLSPLGKLTQLNLLSLGGSTIRDISPLEKLTKLTKLSVLRSPISDVSPLKELAKLTWLELRANNISDVAPLAKLTKLNILALEANNISDVSPLEKLTNLESLVLRENDISDVSPLKTLTQLETLWLEANNISDVSPLKTLTQLERLVLNDNPLNRASVETHIPALQARGVVVLFDIPASIKILQEPPRNVSIPDANLAAAIREEIGNSITNHTLLNLTRLEVRDRGIRDLSGLEHARNLDYLDLTDNNISDISLLTNLTKLTELRLSRNAITDISPLKTLTKLNRLILNENTITDISPLKTLTKLDYLILWDNNITDISPLKTLTKLEYLSLAVNAISDISVLANLTNLEGLNLSDNNISDISPLTNLTKLEYLDLGDNNISDISVLARLTNLEGLNLSDNNISDISPLTNLTKLESLWLYHNNISDISVLARLTKLELLDLYNNDISDISVLARLTKLESLSLGYNNISDISPLLGLNLSGTNYMSKSDGTPIGLSIGGNPLNRASLQTHIPALQARGVVVSFSKFIYSAPALLPKETLLLTNYPNPFNPETWIPYQLAQPAEVTLRIYTSNGALVRALELGHQPAGNYQSKGRAAYWDGRNELGERVASGLYFYTLTAGEFTATRKMLIRK